MTGTTPVYGIPYPESTDPPNGPSQMQALALEVEAELARIDALHPQAGVAWTAFTPTWTNITVGNGVSECAYFRHGRLVVARFKFTLGSTSVITGTPQPTLPVAGAAAVAFSAHAVANYRDVSAPGTYLGFLIVPNTTVAQFIRANVAGANDGVIGINATNPFTWATGDILAATLAYEAAA